MRFDSQYGFRNHRSTVMTMIDLIEYVTTTLYKKKAFDAIDHEILIKKCIIMVYGDFSKMDSKLLKS